MRRVGRVLGVLVLAWLATSGLVTWALTARPRPPFAEPPPPGARDLRVNTVDGEVLGAWAVDGRADRPAVLLLHGNRSCRSEGVGLLRWLEAQGCGVLTLSLRAHGDSTGDRNDAGYGSRRDVVAAFEAMGRAWPGRPRLVFGRSLGAAAALYAASDLGGRPAGYFLESPYADLGRAVRHRLDLYLPPLADRVAWEGMRLWALLLLPEPLELLRPADRGVAIPETVPVVLVAGERDRRAPVADVEEVRARIPHARLVVFPTAGHGEPPVADPDLYRCARRN